MSSEESEESDSFRIRPLLWRSQKANKLVYSLDHKSQKKKTKKSILMTQKRSEGMPSDRPVPIGDNIPLWAIAK